MSPSQITGFFKGKEIAFETVLEIVRYLIPEKELELMEQYSLNITSPRSIRYAMEYCSTHRLLEALSHLINTATNHQNKQLQETVQMYKLVYKWQTKNFPSETELYTQVKSLCPTDLTIKMLQTILEINILHAQKNYRMVKQVAELNQPIIDQLPDEFIKKSFKARLLQLLGYIEVKVNCNFTRTIERATELLNCNIGSTFNSYSFYLYGLSYMLTDYEKSMSFFKKASSEYKKSGLFAGVNAMQGNIFTLNVIWNKVSNPELQEFLDSKNDAYKQSGKGMYFQSLITKDRELMYDSLTSSLETGDNMLATLASNELKRMGESESYLNRLNKLAFTA